MTTTRAIRNIASRVVKDYSAKSEDLNPALGALTDPWLTALHYTVIRKLQSRKKLTVALRRNLYFYVEALPRVHRGLFWKIFLKCMCAWATRWYRESEEVIDLILGSLACFPVMQDEKGQWVADTCWGKRNEVNKTVRAAYVRSLNTVFDYEVRTRFGVQ